MQYAGTYMYIDFMSVRITVKKIALQLSIKYDTKKKEKELVQMKHFEYAFILITVIAIYLNKF